MRDFWLNLWQTALLAGLRGRELALDFIFPAQCAGCRRVGALLCDRCAGQIAYTPGGASRQAAPAGAPLASIYSMAYATGVLRRAIHRLKYGGQAQLAEPLGDLLGAWWVGQRLGVDLLIPVPLHPRRQRQRGFNQATLLARRVAALAGLPCAEHVLERSRDTRPQVGLNALQRRANVGGAFHCDAPLVIGRRILLLDDVYTTGATLQACAVALKGAGAGDVWGLVLARPAPLFPLDALPI